MTEINSDIIILFDNTSNLSDLKKNIQNKKCKIISLDYQSHKILMENKIKHEISDNYLKEKESSSIQKKCYMLTQWFSQPDIAKLLKYDDINLGELSAMEFNFLLIPFLKKFVEITRIFNIYQSSEFICSPSSYQIVKTMTKSSSRLNNKIINNELQKNIKIHVKVGTRFITLHLPYSYYIKFKKISEIILSNFFGIKKRVTVNKKSVLFAEFDTTWYHKIFEMLPKNPLNLILFHRRRPAIWNFESFSIIKKSNCSIATLDEIKDTNLEKEIKKGNIQVGRKIKLLLSNEEFFKSFFTIENYSFWDALKIEFIELLKKKCLDTVTEIELAKRLFQKCKFSAIIIGSEVAFNELILLKLAKKFNVTSILLQHGLYYDDFPQSFEYNKFLGVLPIYSDKFIVWGESTKEYAIKCGISPQKIEVLGSPILDDVFDIKKEKNNKEEFILLATSSPTDYFVRDLSIEIWERYESAIKKICETVTKSNKKLIIKLHPYHQEYDITKLVKQINPDIEVIKKGDIKQLIKSCEIFIAIDISTTILTAQILEKPVISMSVKEYFDIPEILKSDSCMITNVREFESTFFHLIDNQKVKKKLIKKGTSFVNRYLSNQGIASQKNLEFLECQT